MKHRSPMPGYYWKTMVKNAQRKFLRRKELEYKEKLAAKPGAAANRENRDRVERKTK